MDSGFGIRGRTKHVKSQIPNPESLLKWYARHRRDLPWRAKKGEKPDPYRVWLSEVMLQQTTVATVSPYFLKFIARWPTLKHLADAQLDDILRLWAGLGYYRRAKMLHVCAREVVKKHGGVFSQDEKALLGLPGFGPYTAAAVVAIAFGISANVVDGNVERVIARIFAIKTPLPKAKAELRLLAAGLVPQEKCGDYAQALMDLGATVCTPRNPKCDLCPWRGQCRALSEGIQGSLPRRAKKKAKPVRRAIAFALFTSKGEILLQRRPATGLLAHMMGVPTSPWVEGKRISLKESLAYAPAKANWIMRKGIVRHVFTHFTLELSIAAAKTTKKGGGHWISLEKLSNEALPSVMRKAIFYAQQED